MALLSSVESAPRAYRLKASNAASPISTSIGTMPVTILIGFSLARPNRLFSGAPVLGDEHAEYPLTDVTGEDLAHMIDSVGGLQIDTATCGLEVERVAESRLRKGVSI